MRVNGKLDAFGVLRADGNNLDVTLRFNFQLKKDLNWNWIKISGTFNPFFPFWLIIFIKLLHSHLLVSSVERERKGNERKQMK